MVALQRFKQRFEIAFAKAVVTFALDEFKEHWAQLGFREDLQQQARRAAFGGAVHQNAPGLQLSYRLAVAAPDGMNASRAAAAVRDFVAYAEAQIKAVPLRGVRVESLQSSRATAR